MARGKFIVEFRSGSLFRGPRSDFGSTLGEAMRSSKSSTPLPILTVMLHGAWHNGACVMQVPKKRRTR